MPRKHIIVSGRVQGVGFRFHTYQLAGACALTGWVRNLDFGDVEMEIQGHEQNIEKFLDNMGKKSRFIRIDRVDMEDCMEIRESSFEIRN